MDHLPRPLDLKEVAKIKAICPDLLELAYVPTSSLDASDKKKRKREEDLFELPTSAVPEYTLLLEFSDGKVNTGKVTRRGYHQPRTKPENETMKMITQRNEMFQRAQLDPIVLLMEASEKYIPVRPGELPADQERRSQRERLEAWSLDPNSKPTVQQILAELPQQPWWRDQIVAGGRRTFPARPAVYKEPDAPLNEEVRTAIQHTHNISQLYLHQALAVNAFQQGKNVVVSTGTSSGKSLVYQVPIATALLQDDEATAMCIFPTKALSQDQLLSLRRLFNACSLQNARISTYDGDTPTEERRGIRDEVRVLFTNPDMLHQSILPNEERWRRFFRGLRIVVVDELHVYTGTFGVHVALILRRLRRLCAALGNSNIQFVSCSATIANPSTHMSSLLALPVDCITSVQQDGSPHGRKEWAIWNPPEIDTESLGGARVSGYTELSQLFRHLIMHGLRTIVFAKVRRTCEIVVRQVREDLARDGHPDLAQRVHGYRSGYSPADRRELEQAMLSGDTLGLVATTALELGMDIGSLDAVIMFGMPYSLASMWQQAGRAGRRQRDALVVLLTETFAVDQYCAQNPELIFTESHSPLWLDTQNELILTSHLQCAAIEVPICVEEDTQYFGPRLEALCASNLERDTAGFYHYTDVHGARPELSISIRGARQETYKYIDVNTGAVLEEVEVERVFFEAFQGAVFLHQGLTYLCEDVLHDMHIALMRRADVLYHTRQRDFTDTDATQVRRIRSLEHAQVLAYFGQVTLTSHVWGYYKVDRRANILDMVEIDSMPMVRTTQGIWIDVPWGLVQVIAEHGVNASAAIHATEHAILSLTPLFVASGTEDVRTECKLVQREVGDQKTPTKRKRPSRLIFYDKPGQDGGICAQVFQHLDALLRIALSVIEACPCANGCPGCIETTACSGDATVSSKAGACAVLRGLLRLAPFPDDEPMHKEPGHARSVLTAAESLAATLCSPEPVPTQGDIQVENVLEEAIPERPWPGRAHGRSIVPAR
ncbi:ATP-dependent 3'-5' DNA helicase [Malassezia yamatoensis]|uniref:ATP-dependent 3'-5' DNA helicase n=1 Tax=Malassezia yamatoensis TaxID=253288 RepID=A0AAJ5YRA3_9BASI|nr:ATP-dependent 3'-5' DNA helicase [Malassezia yamatoensis]